MAPTNKVHYVTTIARVATMLCGDEDWLWDIAVDMDQEDGMIWVYDLSDDGVMAVIVAALVRIDSPGPILFRQDRVGYRNKLFSMFEFRTMHAHAADPMATRQTIKDDVRVTRVGRVLRQFSVDELP